MLENIKGLKAQHGLLKWNKNIFLKLEAIIKIFLFLEMSQDATVQKRRCCRCLVSYYIYDKLKNHNPSRVKDFQRKLRLFIQHDIILHYSIYVKLISWHKTVYRNPLWAYKRTILLGFVISLLMIFNYNESYRFKNLSMAFYV